MGQPLNRERPFIPGADTVPNVEGHTNGRAISERPDDPAWSQTLACAEASCTGTGRSHGRPAAFLTRAALVRIGKPSVRKFLGFSFTFGSEPRRRIAPQAIARFKARVRELTRRSCGRSLTQIVKEPSVYLIGWRGYFGFCQTPSVLRKLDEWLRRRLRAIVWKQWKHGRARFAELRRCGVGRDLAAKTAGSPHGPWRLSNSPALSLSLPNAYFRSLGLTSMHSRDMHNPANRRIRTRTYGGVGVAPCKRVEVCRLR
jgi:hypothetical protein